MTTARQVRLFNTAYRSFELPARRRVRAESYEDDMGQNSWPTKDEWRVALGCLGLTAESRVLDVARGSDRPDLDLARAVGADVVGVDVEPGQPGAGTPSWPPPSDHTRRDTAGCGALVHHNDEVQRPPAGERVATHRPPGGGFASTACRRSR
jgi:hypothetical protein